MASAILNKVRKENAKFIVLAVIILFCPSGLHAQSTTPAIVADGVAAYQKSGAAAAVDAWLKGSPIENDTTARAGLIGGLSQMQAAYGNITGFDPVRVVSVTPSFRFVYILLKFEKGPIFSKFDCYKTGKGWIITQLVLNAKAANVWPDSMLVGER